MVLLRADNVCVPDAALAAGHLGYPLCIPTVHSPRELEIHSQMRRRGCAEGSTTGSVMDRGRDKHKPHGNSVNPPYHTSGAEKRQEPDEV